MFFNNLYKEIPMDYIIIYLLKIKNYDLIMLGGSMDDNLKKIRALTENLDFSGNNSDEFLFTINCVDYFYYGGNIGKVDIIDGFTDGANDGGIDFVYSDSENLIHLIH